MEYRTKPNIDTGGEFRIQVIDPDTRVILMVKQ
jgi:hypothetical protein